MDQHIQETWDQLLQTVSQERNIGALMLAGYLVLGGLMAFYVRYLYRLCGASAGDSDSVTRVFPLLTMVTIGVIAVVKGSMALSLGLVGALSIVRFRAAIKEPEELVYLFLCIGIGLGLGAGEPLLAIVLVLVATVFIVGMHFLARGKKTENLLLTISGDADKYFQDTPHNVLKTLGELCQGYSLQRLDVENQRGQVRVVLRERDEQWTNQLVQRLRERLPDCELSYVNLRTNW